MPRAFHYELFGLSIRSGVELPELPPRPPAAHVDVTITEDEIAPNGADGWLWTAEGATVMQIDGVARFSVRDGAEIRVDPHLGAAARDVRIYLLGSVMGLLLHQRALLPLHANAVRIGDAVIAFMGESGSGKSTLAAWFHDQGFEILADDVCAVRIGEGGKPLLYPGVPRLRLWRDALERTGRNAADYQLSFTGNSEREKFDLPIAPATAAQQPGTLVAIYVLETGSEFAIEQLEGLAAAEALFAHTYRGLFVARLGGHVAHWQSCMALVRTVGVFRVRRTLDIEHFEHEARLLSDHATEQARPRPSVG